MKYIALKAMLIGIVTLAFVGVVLDPTLPNEYYVTTSVKAVSTTVSKLDGKNIAFIGDSLTSEADYKKYINYIRENTGSNSINFGENGSTIALQWEGDNSFVSRYKNIIKEYPDPDYFDVIVIFGGVNDYANNVPLGNLSTENFTFYGGLNEVVYQLQYYYPKAKIVLMTPLISTNNNFAFDYSLNSQGKTLEDYRKAMREVARTQGAILFETHMQSGLNPNNGMVMYKYYDANFVDGVHPNTEGHKRIAIPLVNMLESLFY